MEKEYYIKMDNEDFGPFDFDKVCSFNIFEKTFVSVPQDNAGWRMAKDIPELQGYIVSEETLNLVSLESVSYYLREGTVIRGPYSLTELAMLGITKESVVGVNSTTKWYFAECIPGLLAMIEGYNARATQNQASESAEDLYYVSLDNENFGPFNMDGLKGLGLFTSTLVRNCNEDFWRRAETLADLQGHLVSDEPAESVASQTAEPIRSAPEASNPLLYDMSENANEVYEKYRKEIVDNLSLQKDLIRAAKANNPAQYSEEMFEMAALRYNRAFDDMIEVLRSV